MTVIVALAWPKADIFELSEACLALSNGRPVTAWRVGDYNPDPFVEALSGTPVLQYGGGWRIYEADPARFSPEWHGIAGVRARQMLEAVAANGDL